MLALSGDTPNCEITIVCCARGVTVCARAAADAMGRPNKRLQQGCVVSFTRSGIGLEAWDRLPPFLRGKSKVYAVVHTHTPAPHSSPSAAGALVLQVLDEDGVALPDVFVSASGGNVSFERHRRDDDACAPAMPVRRTRSAAHADTDRDDSTTDRDGEDERTPLHGRTRRLRVQREDDDFIPWDAMELEEDEFDARQEEREQEVVHRLAALAGYRLVPPGSEESSISSEGEDEQERDGDAAAPVAVQGRRWRVGAVRADGGHQQQHRDSLAWSRIDVWHGPSPAAYVPKLRHLVLQPGDAGEIILSIWENLLPRKYLQDTIIPAINARGAAQRGTRWDQMGEAEFRRFLGLLMATTLYAPFKRRAMWSTTTRLVTHRFGAVMSRDRFEELLAMFTVVPHTSLPADAASAEAGNPDADVLAAVRPWIDAWNEHMAAAFIPGEALTVDETMVPFRGKGMPYRVKLSRKPGRLSVGREYRTAACSETKVCIRMDPVEGGARNRYPHPRASRFHIDSVTLTVCMCVRDASQGVR